MKRNVYKPNDMGDQLKSRMHQEERPDTITLGAWKGRKVFLGQGDTKIIMSTEIARSISRDILAVCEAIERGEINV